MTISSDNQSQQLQQLFQAVTETRDAVTALNSEFLSGKLYSYVNWNSSPALFKLGFTTNLERRGKQHIMRGYQYVSHTVGTIASEKRLKLLLSQSGFKPVAGDETFHLTKDFLILLYQVGWPIGELASQIDTFGFQATLDLWKNNQSNHE